MQCILYLKSLRGVNPVTLKNEKERYCKGP